MDKKEKTVVCKWAIPCGYKNYCQHRKEHEEIWHHGVNYCSGAQHKPLKDCPSCIEVKASLYSNPPSPEMVCPECEGFGNIPTRGMTKSSAQCPKCNGTGKVPSPEPPEKVRELLLTKNEIENTIWGEIPHTNGARIRLYGFQRDNAVCQAQLLKLQQKGWGKHESI